MSKPFFEVFPTLQLDSMIASFFEQVTVERITSTRRKDYLRIYLSSEHLIQKDMIFKVDCGNNLFNDLAAFKFALSFFPHTIVTGQVILFKLSLKSKQRMECVSFSI